MTKEIVKEYVDIETGEILSLCKGDTLRIIKEGQRKIIEKNKYYNDLDLEVKQFSEEMGGFISVLFKYGHVLLNEYEDMDDGDITRLFYIATYIGYHGYIIFKNKKVKKNDLMTMLDLKQRHFDNLYSKLIKYKIIIKDFNKFLMINKNLFIKGNIKNAIMCSDNYSRIYINTIRYLYENVDRTKLKHLGYLFQSLPYVHRQSNMLCWNPDSKHEKTKKMTTGELKDVLGVHRHTIRKFINTLVDIKLKNGESVAVVIKNSSNDKNLPIFFNKNVFYGGNFDLPGGRKYIDKIFEPKEDKRK